MTDKARLLNLKLYILKMEINASYGLKIIPTDIEMRYDLYRKIKRDLRFENLREIRENKLNRIFNG